MSDRDIGAGERWSEEIEMHLRASGFGVICVTSNNRQAPWLNFEAGAISNNFSEKGDKKARVVPYLLDFGFADLKGPLATFHGKEADEKGTWELVFAINAITATHKLGALEKTFGAFWQDLLKKLDIARKNLQSSDSASQEAPKRSLDDKLDEVLLLMRNIPMSSSSRHTKILERFGRKDNTLEMQVNNYLQYLESIDGVSTAYTSQDMTALHVVVNNRELSKNDSFINSVLFGYRNIVPASTISVGVND